MFNLMQNSSFIHFAIERGNIPFVVHGNLTCESNFAFYWGIQIGRPTYKVRVVAENPVTHEHEMLKNVHFHEFTDEVVFPGEIELPDASPEGVSMALSSLEMWADFLCLATGNRKIQVEVQQPVTAVGNVKMVFSGNDLDRWADYISRYANLGKEEKKQYSRALGWYRKGCAAQYYSIYDAYTAYWNVLEILCEVSGGREKKGEQVEQAIWNDLQMKLQASKHQKIGRKDIIRCYKDYVLYSIRAQMEDALKDIFGNDPGAQWAYYCFKVKPEKDALYKIRNDINHGNIREDNVDDYRRVWLRIQILSYLVMQILNRKLGRNISAGETDVHAFVNSVLDNPEGL